MKIVFATTNKGKLEEFKDLVKNLNIEVLSLDDFDNIPEVVEDGDTFKKNSLKKAFSIADITNMITIADDSGLCIDALNGEPGIYTARQFPEYDNYADKCNAMIKRVNDTNDDNRKAHFVCALSIAYPDGRYNQFRGECYGEILHNAKGNHGHGYDPIFYSYELNKAFGESTLEEKASVSHRGKAFSQLITYLNNN